MKKSKCFFLWHHLYPACECYVINTIDSFPYSCLIMCLTHPCHCAEPSFRPSPSSGESWPYSMQYVHRSNQSYRPIMPKFHRFDFLNLDPNKPIKPNQWIHPSIQPSIHLSINLVHYLICETMSPHSWRYGDVKLRKHVNV